MREGRSVGLLAIGTFIVLIIVVLFIQTARLNQVRAELETQTKAQANYEARNYTTEATLYAVKPDGTCIVVDTAGRTWETGATDISNNERVLLAIRNGVLSNIYKEVWRLGS